jgi:hypothetical protein
MGQRPDSPSTLIGAQQLRVDNQEKGSEQTADILRPQRRQTKIYSTAVARIYEKIMEKPGLFSLAKGKEARGGNRPDNYQRERTSRKVICGVDHGRA